mgnify:CR=1 FL=1|jgi:hypothetical protein
MPYSILLALSLSAFVLSAHAESSFELLCRNQAKEIAAETYKNCVTEQRQGQVEQIRKEYQQKLADLKSHYDGELKKVSSGKIRSAAPKQKMSSDDNIKTETKSVLKRSSGARELPEKKVSTNTLKTEVIDFTSPTKRDTESIEENTEIVEIPVE